MRRPGVRPSSAPPRTAYLACSSPLFSSDSLPRSVYKRCSTCKYCDVLNRLLTNLFGGNALDVAEPEVRIEPLSFGPIVFWDVTSGKKLKTLEGSSSGVTAVTFDWVGGSLASDSRHIMIWDLSGKRETRAIANELEGSAYALAFSPDSKMLAVPYGGTISLFDITSGESATSLGEHRYTAHALAFSLDGKTLAIGTGDLSITLRNVATDQVLINREGRGFADGNFATAFTSDRKLFAIAEDGKKIGLWDFKKKKKLRTITDRLNGVRSLAFRQTNKNYDQIRESSTHSKRSAGPRLTRFF